MEIIRFGTAIVRIYERGDGKWLIKWREAGKPRSTTRTRHEDAVEIANAEARRLDSASGRRWVTAEESDLVARLKGLCGDRSPFLFLEGVEEALKQAGGFKELRLAADEYGTRRAKEGGRTLMDLYERLEREYRDHRRAMTWKTMKVEFKPYADSMGDMDLAAITPELVEEWCGRGEPSPRTYNNRRSKWSAALGRARELGWIDQHQRTAAEISPKRREQRKSPSIWSLEDGKSVLDLLRAKSPDLVRYFALQCWAGLRPSEAQAITLADLESVDGYIHVTAEVAGKLSTERFVPLQPNLKEILEALPRDAADLIPAGRAMHWRKRDIQRLERFASPVNADTRLSKVVRASRIVEKWPADICRHSFCSYRLAQTHAIGTVAEESGNSESTIRKSYRRPLPREKGDAWFTIGL